MNPSRFDTVSRLFAGRRSRRNAVASGLGLAAAAVSALAQDATPIGTPTFDPSDPHPSADDAAPKAFFLFVQPFASGNWAPKAGEEEVYTMTLTGAAANTVYFSDRPDRMFGLTPNQQFLDGLGFTPANPPNAAVVAQREGADDQEILVIELFNPAYDAAAETLTYDARVLADYGEPGLAYAARQQQDYEISETFGSGSLFIDDCSDATVSCFASRDGSPVGAFSAGMCWDPQFSQDWASLGNCSPCSDLTQQCAEHFGDKCIICADRDAQGQCTVYTYICYPEMN